VLPVVAAPVLGQVQVVAEELALGQALGLALGLAGVVLQPKQQACVPLRPSLLAVPNCGLHQRHLPLPS
jgi:hypothetical protein